MNRLYGKNKVFSFVISFLFFFSLFLTKIRAIDIITYGQFTNGSWSSSSSNCWATTYPCWAPDNNHNAFYRFTLVDSNGKKVSGTKSVNFSGASFYKSNVKNYNYRSISTPDGTADNIDYLSYKFSDGTDKTIIDNKSDNLFVYDSRIPIQPSSMEIFLKNGELKKYNSTDWDGTSFLIYFLRLCGYFTDADKLSYDSDKVNSLYDYYIVTEIGYPVWWIKNGYYYRYGTINEWIQYINSKPENDFVRYNHRKNFLKNPGMCLNKNDINSLIASGFDYYSSDIFAAGVCDSTSTSLDNFINKSYGVSVSSISDIIIQNKFKCKKIGNFFWGNNYSVVSESEYIEQCKKPEVHTCQIIDGKYWGKNSTVVDKDTYKNQCLHMCDIIDNGNKKEYWGSNYTIVDENTWKKECEQKKYKCKIIDNSGTIEYWGKNSTIVDNFNIWQSECQNGILSFEMLSCDNNGGKVALNADNNVGYSFNKSFLKVKGQDENQSVYCYDTVEYNFSDTISDLNKDTFSYLSFVNPRSSHVNITRHCLVNKDATYEINDFKNDISDYKNSNIKINFYNEDYIINPKIDESSFTKLVRNDNYDGNGGKYVEYSFTMTYEVPKNKLYIGANLSDGASGSISLVDWKNSFGKSKELLHSLFTYYTDSDFLEDDGYVSSDYTTCHFDYDVVNEDIDIQFRIISLENPFPARDGSSRMPSNIWLNEKNNVFEYITNNRGIRSVSKSDNVSPETMYSNTEPMYRIVLTPSTMMKIREYNKKYSYYSMFSTNYTEEGKETKAHEKARAADKNADKLICDEEGMQCYSQFLRDSKYIPQDESSLNGDCLLIRDTKDDSRIRSVFNSYTNYDDLNLNVLIQSLDNGEKYSDSRYDLNYNNRSDADDYHILALYGINKTSGEAQKNTSYYTCANKSFLSGGPEESEG